MPELPEVETVRRGLQPMMEGAHIVRVEQRRGDLRFPFPERFIDTLVGRRIISLGRRAKYLLVHLDADPVLVCHLGMSGSFRLEWDGNGFLPGEFHYGRTKLVAHDHVVLHLTSANNEALRVVYNDPRRFGFMQFASGAALDSHPLLAGLGVEPTGNALDGALLNRLLAGRRNPLKAALLDQRLIAGLGNIYVCEALWRAGLSPRRRAGTITSSHRASTLRTELLATSIRATVADAIAAGGSSLRDYVRADGTLGYFQHTFSVYDREGMACARPGCNGRVVRFIQSGRSTFCCPACQR